VSIRPPVCLIQNSNFMCIRFILRARSVCYLLVHLFLPALRFACRFKVVLGTARTTQIEGGVTVAKAQRNPCGVVVGQHNIDPPQIELSPTLIERSGTNPSGFYQTISASGSLSKPAPSFIRRRFGSPIVRARPPPPLFAPRPAPPAPPAMYLPRDLRRLLRPPITTSPLLAFLMPNRIDIPQAHRITAVALHLGVFQGIVFFLREELW
jgi:hypothetical protein